MYSKKNAGPRSDPWGTLAFSGYSCEGFPSRSCLLLRKKKGQISNLEFHRLNFMKKTNMLNPAKSLGYIKSATVPVAPDLLRP